MSGGKGGRQDTEVTMPAFAEEALQQGVGMSKDVSSLGYVPYYGPDVAAFSPQQEASFAATRRTRRLRPENARHRVRPRTPRLLRRRPLVAVLEKSPRRT